MAQSTTPQQATRPRPNQGQARRTIDLVLDYAGYVQREGLVSTGPYPGEGETPPPGWPVRRKACR